MTDGRCKFGPRAKREMSRNRQVDGMLADDCDDDARPLARGLRGRARLGRLVRAAPAGPRPLPLAAERRPGAADPRGTREDQLGRDAPAVPLRPPPLDDRARPAPPRRVQALALVGAPDVRRYEWSEAEALQHIDGFELPEFRQRGHWVDGERSNESRTRGWRPRSPAAARAIS
jgi:hypothetical protein